VTPPGHRTPWQSAVEILEAHARALQEQRDDLVAALRDVVTASDTECARDLYAAADRARVALAAFRDKA
jgi:hypothetical protein